MNFYDFLTIFNLIDYQGIKENLKLRVWEFEFENGDSKREILWNTIPLEILRKIHLNPKWNSVPGKWWTDYESMEKLGLVVKNQ